MSEPRSDQIAAMMAARNSGAQAVLAIGRFSNRGFSQRTAAALAETLDAPERLLFMDLESIKAVPGIGKGALREIEAYRRQFMPA